MESTPVFGTVGAIRVVRQSVGDLGRFVDVRYPDGRRRGGDERGARGSGSGPLHRCVHAGSGVTRSAR